MNTKSTFDIVRKTKYSAGEFAVASIVALHAWVTVKFIYGVQDLSDLRDNIHPTLRDYILNKLILRSVLFVTALTGYFALCCIGSLYNFMFAVMSIFVTVPGIFLEDAMGLRLSWGHQELLLSQCNESYGSPQGLSYFPTWRGNNTIDTPEVAADWCYRQWRNDWDWNLNWLGVSVVVMPLLVFPCVFYLRQVWFSVREVWMPKPEPKRYFAKIDQINTADKFDTERVTAFSIVLYIATVCILCKVTADYGSLAEVGNHPILSKHVQRMAFVNVFIFIVGLFSSLGLLLGPVFGGMHSILFFVFLIPGAAYTTVAEMKLTWKNKELLLDVCADSQDQPGGLTYAIIDGILRRRRSISKLDGRADVV